MFCRLCIVDCEDYKSLYDAEGKQSIYFIVTAKYFENLLHDMYCTTNDQNKCSRVICTNCWSRISDFNDYQESIIATQEQLIQFEEFGKLELLDEDEFDTTLQQVDIGLRENSNNIEKDPMECESNVDEITIKKDKSNSFDDANNVDDGKEELALSTLKKTNRPNPIKSKSRRSMRIVKKKYNVHKSLKESSTNNANINNDFKEEEENQPHEEEKDHHEQEEQQSCSKTRQQDRFIEENWKKEFSCELCGQICENFTQLRSHFRKEHNNDNGYVRCCQNKYYDRLRLVEHIEMHLNPEKFKCLQCEKRYSNRRTLVNHVKAVHGAVPLERLFECDICQKRFAKKSVLRSHMDIHAQGSKDFVCSHCGKGFVLEHRLKIHIRNVHSASYCSVCELCGKSFRGRYTLKQHLLEHEGVGKRKWNCDTCDAQLNTKFSLARHKRVAHHDGSTLYVCSECGKVALTEDALRSHKRYVHQKERKYKCTICDKAFKVAVVLREHMSTHTGQDLYKCPHCPKTFKVNANMHHHRKRVHPKEWEETRQRRNLPTQIDLSQISNEIVL